MRRRFQNLDDFERATGIQRNVPRSPTRRDVDNITRKRLSRWPAWRKKLSK